MKRKRSKCKQCCIKTPPPYIRKCPICGKEIIHTTLKHRNRAEKNKQWCIKCRMGEVNSRPEVRAKRSEVGKRYIGDKNPFFGKHHTDETKEKWIGRNKKNKSEEFKKKISLASKGDKNGMYGRTFYSVWIEKYGKEEADKRMVEHKKKLSERFSGKNNPMYGKPSPSGSGGGWGGWYKNWFFRSLRELCYMINVIEAKNYQWVSGEKINIPYTDYKGKERTYRPDFLLNEKILIEVKPKKLMETPSNVIKKQAAELYCKINGLEYRMTDVKIDMKNIIFLFESGKIKFVDKYIKRMKKICRLAKNKK